MGSLRAIFHLVTIFLDNFIYPCNQLTSVVETSNNSESKHHNISANSNLVKTELGYDPHRERKVTQAH